MSKQTGFELQAARRDILRWLTIGAALPLATACGGGEVAAKAYPVFFSEAEWRRRLSPSQFRILRDHGTEPSGSSPLNAEKRRGTYRCAGCDNELFASTTKYESGTGWPSFWRPLPGGIGTSADYKLGYPRTEVHCADCGGHLGHVFDDGPRPTGLRHCMNGAAMKFRPT